MSVATRSPLRFLGAQNNSGCPNTGEMPFIRGGQFRATIWSGALAPNLSACPTGALASGGHVLLTSGAGRLNSMLQHTQMASGLPVFFYDAGAIAPSGVSVSGQAIIGLIPPTYGGGLVSGNVATGFDGKPINNDIVFTSGLCVAVPSGTPGFTLTWTPDNSPNNG